MKNQIKILLALSLAASPLTPVFGQTPPASPSTVTQQNQQHVRITSAEVLLDVVVKNKKGQSVIDLAADDFEVFEDGVKQPIESFKLISRSSNENTTVTTNEAAPASPTKKPVEKKTDPDIGVSVVALVFDRLSPDSRKRAHDAAMSYLGDTASLSNFVGVFAINLSLNAVQNYTTDIGLVKSALERAGSLASASYDSTRSSTADAIASAKRDAAISSALAGAAAGGPAAAAAGSTAGTIGVDQQFASMQERTRETFEVLQRDQQGYATTNGLMAIVNSMQRLPGRKAVIFFSEGLSLPPNVQQHFRSVINAANRANVSVYSIDAMGLRTESTLEATRTEIESRSRRRMDNLDRAMNTSGPLTTGLERNEDLLKSDPQSGLTQLANETGGTFIGDTNKLGPRLKQIDEELGTYYLMSYSPTNQNYDGKFRNISVKVKKSGVDVQARKGYYAVSPIGTSPMFYYEALPLGALNNPSRPKDFPLLTHSLNFPEAERTGFTAIEVEAAASSFTFNADNERKVYSTDFSIVVLVKDQSKQVVDKLSYHYVLVGPLNSINAAKKGRILFYRETNLPPGKYNVEAVAYDALNNKASINTTSIEIPDTDEGKLRLSSVMIIKRAEQLKEKTDSPFRVGELLIYPNLGEPVSKAGKQMGFYFNVYTAKGSTDLPRLVLEILQESKSIAKVPLKLSPPDATGRIQYASALPLDSLPPGNYELKITVNDLRSVVSRSTPFVLEQ